MSALRSACADLEQERPDHAFQIAEQPSTRFGWPLYPIDDCGHFVIGERPAAFADDLRAAMGPRS